MQTGRRIAVPRPTRAELIEKIIAAGSLKAAAATIGVSRMTLYRWTRELDIEVRKGVVAAA